MTVYVAETQPLGPHPLATLRGVLAFDRMIQADKIWRPLPDRQKAALQTAYDTALAGARPGDVLPMPALPDGTHPATVRALTRRGLVADGRLTGLAVSVTHWCRPRPVRERAVDTVQPIGDRL